VPPDPAICKTSNTIAIAFPTSPNTETSEQTMSINTKLINKPNTTNQTDSLTGTSINKMSPDVAMRLCKIPIAIKVKKRPKYTSRPVNASASCTSTDKSEINRIAPTQKASTV